MQATLRVSIVFFLCLLALSGRTAEPDPSLPMLGALSRFMADIQLSMYEPENSEFADSANSSWAALQQQYPVWLQALSEADHRAAQAVWDELLATVEGDEHYDGLLDIGFDTTLNANLRFQMESLRTLLLKQPSMAAENLTPLQALWARHYRTLAGYMQVATTPLGGMSLGAEDLDMSPPHMVQETDKVWDEALAAATLAQKSTLTRARHRWEFVRETVLSATQRSLPYAVNTQITSILRDVEWLISEQQGDQ